MYSTCIFCHASLGANDAVEHFPVGRRLAYDAARGRLWVVCRRCERWNLTPLEERWEAIEECERLFGGTRLRVSTDNIGLARVADGLELVRIGAPQRPELAAWRYGDQFGRRRRRHLVYTGAGLAAAAGIVILGPLTGVIAGSSWAVWNAANSMHTLYQNRRVRARLVVPEFDVPVGIRIKQLNRVALVRDEGDWALQVPFTPPKAAPLPLSNGRVLQASRLNAAIESTALLKGEAALHAAGKLLPALNAAGAKRDEVSSALTLIGDAGDPAALFGKYADGAHLLPQHRTTTLPAARHLANLPKAVRLAMEMATHEDSERRALEGELSVLEDAWKQAEEIAAIADDLFVSDDTRARVERLKELDEPGERGG